MTEEKTTTTAATAPEGTGRIPRPEEIVAHYEEAPEEQRVQPLRCRAGSKTDNPCPREATTWMYPEDRDYPMCEEHARANELAFEAMDRDITESITADWLRIARAWGFEDLEQLAINAHESAKEESLKAEARASLAREIADAPRNADERPNLTREQDQKLRELVRRGDSLNDAYTTLEDAPLKQFGDEETSAEKARRRILAVLAGERDKGWEEAYRYKEELGLHVIGSEKPQPREASGAGKPPGGEQACA